MSVMVLMIENKVLKRHIESVVVKKVFVIAAVENHAVYRKSCVTQLAMYVYSAVPKKVWLGGHIPDPAQ